MARAGEEIVMIRETTSVPIEEPRAANPPEGRSARPPASATRGPLPHSVGSSPFSSPGVAPDEVRASYDEMHARGRFESPPGFLDFVFEAARLSPGQRLLDIGCGRGELLVEAADRGVLVSGVDISPGAVQAAVATLPFADVRVGSGTELPWHDGSFDRVTCIGTLEHLPDPEAGAREIARVLTPEGIGVVYVPNTYYWLAIAHTIRRGEGHDEGQLIQRHGARNEWRDLLEGNGLSVQAVRTWRYPVRLRPFRPRILFGSLIERVVPENLLLAFAYVVRPCGSFPRPGGEESPRKAPSL
jgi:SAM-dependent methyltransferase